ncbi:MAG: dTDP-4-dehydrorhamnose 3,5-epimerase [Actinomycetota bacterium]
MKPLKTLLGGALLIEHPRFEDTRGSFRVLYEAVGAESAGLPPAFVQDNASYSLTAGTIRGLHLQLPPWEQGKLIRVMRGRVLDVLVDLRPGSETQGGYETVELAAADERQLWLPPGFAHGFCTLEPETEVFYKVDTPYRPEAELTLAWDDPTLGIEWPVAYDQAVLSDKDREGRSLGEVTDAIAAAIRALSSEAEPGARRDG